MAFHDPKLILTILAACAGGYAGVKLGIPAGALIGALIATMAVQLLGAKVKEVPYLISFIAQVFIGLIIGSGVTPKIFEDLARCWVPLVISMGGIVLIGVIFAFVIFRMGFLDFPTAFLGTSPGAMSAVVLLGVEYGANAAIVALFHFFRILVVLVSAPLILHLWAKWG